MRSRKIINQQAFWIHVGKQLAEIRGNGIHPKFWKGFTIEKFISELEDKVNKACTSFEDKILYFHGGDSDRRVHLKTFRRIFSRQGGTKTRFYYCNKFALFFDCRDAEEYMIKYAVELEQYIPFLSDFSSFKNSTLNIPKEFVTGICQYMIFFSEFVDITKGVELDFHIKKNKEGITIKVEYEESSNKDNVKKWFDEYVGFAKNGNVNNLIFDTEIDLDANQIDLLTFKLESQISALNESLRLARLENRLLKKHSGFLEKLSLTFSKRDNVIQNQYIQGGNQQFADKIDNKT